MNKDAFQKNFLLVNKPADWTSFDVVNFIRKRKRLETGIRNIKVGHAGTLDPFATGLLIVAVGRDATKRIDEFKNLPKTYVATLRFGATSNTGDSTGTIVESQNVSMPTVQTLESTLAKFVGRQQQTPPMFSAKSVGGQRLYTLARAGKEIQRQPEEIEIFSLRLIDYDWPRATIEVACSPGTYIRTLAEDIGAKLGTGAYCDKLERTAIGEYLLTDARDIKSFG